MKIGVISDTHISLKHTEEYQYEAENRSEIEVLCQVLEPFFYDTSFIIHAGDITDFSLIEELGRFAKVHGVAGNMDNNEIYNKLGEKKVIEVNGFKIGIIHGWGGREKLSYKVRQRFNNDNVHCIVFGHSHYPYDRIEDSVLMFNPGSPTDKRFADSRNIGILHIEEKIWGEHISLD